jgi:DNA-binding GntR family transcriptional regulator
VDIVPFKGAAVSKISLKDLEEAYIIQQDLEGLASFLATQRLTGKEIEKLEKIHQSSRTHVQGDVTEWKRWNTRFHRVFIDHCGNSRLIKLVESHRDQFARFWFPLLSTPGLLENNMREHERIIKAVEAGKPLLVRHLMEKHIGKGRQELLEIVKNVYPSTFIP